jgi:ABC-type methionine transport system permease subunit
MRRRKSVCTCATAVSSIALAGWTAMPGGAAGGGGIGIARHFLKHPFDHTVVKVGT